MAGQAGQPPHPVEPLEALKQQPERFTLFAALRLLEVAHGGPRLGESRRASDDAVRLGQPPHLIFAPSDVQRFQEEPGHTKPRLMQYSVGIFGPNGALPLHLTEYAHERERQHEDPTFADFVNTFQHRMISLFYRAWADADPAANFDRPASDRFVTYLGSLLGLAPESTRRRDDVLDYAKLSRCGQFAPHARSLEALESILRDYFELPIEIKPYTGDWLSIPPDAYFRLGGERQHALLGAGATLGANSWQCQHKFEIVIGPLSLKQFHEFLPRTRALRELRDLVRFYTNDEFAWQVRLALRDVEVPGVTLGEQGRLGWTTWMGRLPRLADDVVLQGDDRWIT